MFKTGTQVFNCDSITIAGIVLVSYYVVKGPALGIYVTSALFTIALAQSIYWHIKHYKLTGKLY